MDPNSEVLNEVVGVLTNNTTNNSKRASGWPWFRQGCNMTSNDEFEQLTRWTTTRVSPKPTDLHQSPQRSVIIGGKNRAGP